MSVVSSFGASLIGLILTTMVWSAYCSPSLALKVTVVSPLMSSSTASKYNSSTVKSTVIISGLELERTDRVNWSEEIELPSSSVSVTNGNNERIPEEPHRLFVLEALAILADHSQ